MDHRLRELERQAASGDALAQQQLTIHQIRSGIDDYGTIPTRIWSFLKFPGLHPGSEWVGVAANWTPDEAYTPAEERRVLGQQRRARRDIARLACRLARTNASSTAKILSPHLHYSLYAMTLALDERYPTLILTTYDDVSKWEELLLGTQYTDGPLRNRGELKVEKILSRADWRDVTFQPQTVYLATAGNYGLKKGQHLTIPPKMTLVIREPMRQTKSSYDVRNYYLEPGKLRHNVDKLVDPTLSNPILGWVERVLANWGRVWHFQEIP